MTPGSGTWLREPARTGPESDPRSGPNRASWPARFGAARSYCWLVYDHDPDELEALGWEEFITRQWESIFVGYRSWVGRRSLSRRWSDLFEVGLGCPQEIASRLATDEIIDRADRDLEGAGGNAEALLSGMIEVVADLPDDLAEMSELGPDISAEILDQHARLLGFVRAYASDQ
jgi:hypothetical protein